MKKIYIIADMEGISGIDKGEMLSDESTEFNFCVERLMADVNAAIDGAFLGGAEYVAVLDCHNGGGNFNVSLLDKRAVLDDRTQNEWNLLLDESYWGIFVIGAHAMAGTMNAFLDHSMSGLQIYNFNINGERVGELGTFAMTGSHFGVPTIMMSGDQAAADEAVGLINGIETAVVKIGISKMQAQLLPNIEAENLIRQTAKLAVEKDERPDLFCPNLPMEIKIEYTQTDFCDNVVSSPNVKRIDARTASKISNSYLDAWI